MQTGHNDIMNGWQRWKTPAIIIAISLLMFGVTSAAFAIIPTGNTLLIFVGAWLFTYAMGGFFVGRIASGREDFYMLVSLPLVAPLGAGGHFWGLFVAALSARVTRRIIGKQATPAERPNNKVVDMLYLVVAAMAIFGFAVLSTPIARH